MIGIDVGGANLKVVDDAGVHIHYCPLWEQAPITDLLRQYAAEKDDPAAVVMSGELADCFENKREGISFIVASGQREHFPKPGFTGPMPVSTIGQCRSSPQPTGLRPLITCVPCTRMPSFSISAAQLLTSSRSTGLTA